MFCNTEIDWSATGSMLSAIASFFAVFIALYQFQKINRSLNDSNVMKIMEIEFEITRRLERAVELRKSIVNHSSSDSQNSMTSDEIVKIENDLIFYHAAYENYLNSIDRLCSFILKKIIDEDDFKDDYKVVLKSIITAPEFEQEYNGSSNYKSILKLNKKWNLNS